ncbi:heparan-alpha-glucosaminide N-acetyltransferase-like isoform X2 [Mizuhopecten yessoensis]|uniref:Heparan-alpha-glucosaminide N-acetyltransferase n=1 Tax=Mizuhopecten yessoensis TaxID=6573 RepID=A0A210QTQ9_MIZYE|nr:heparan-alpha-glucosaminide N-acetyltransferase-like isoform X1 [Mizuhopecten yessoensis]XP_021350049.1 heparan-alpha-glucosaminide N-acetyltransferase-like isoform X2 [Mizuhopecten yessoensis]OWF52104.1 Heparan-alpha-glucosaminide N-acetyltransferase [Mizuhopecten yessoensis]
MAAPSMKVAVLLLSVFSMVLARLEDDLLCSSTSIPPNKMDRAKLTIISKFPNDIILWTQTTECHGCKLKKTVGIESNTNCTVSLDTRWKMQYQITHDVDKAHPPQEGSCPKVTLKLDEYGIYYIYVQRNPHNSSFIKCDAALQMNMSADSSIPIYVAIGIFVGVALIWVFAINCHRRHWWNRMLLSAGAERLIDPPLNDTKEQGELIKGKQTAGSGRAVRQRLGRTRQSQTKGRHAYTSQDLGSMQNMNTNINPVDNEESRPKKERLKSLDTFRGLSIVIMIFVNYKGGGYWFFHHARWNGLTVADLVFPWFVFIMGTSMAFSYSSLLQKCVPKWKIFLKILKRSCILFVLGLIVNTAGGHSPVSLPNLRILGVLQRFALTYLITASIHLLFIRETDTYMHSNWSQARDILYYWPEWITNFLLIALHCALTFGMDVPNCPKGYLGPGGESDLGKYQNCTGGVAGYIDRMVLGDSHIYNNPTCKEIYNTKVPYDPEGILGTITSCFMCFLGLQAGKILMYFKDVKGRVVRFLIWGFVLCLIAAILCKFSKDDGWIPINKNLWSLSFVLCLAGMAFIALTVCYLMIDVWKIWNGAPFYYPGMNSIVVYIGHEVFHNAFPVQWAVSSTHTALLPLHLWGTFVWVFVAILLYCKKIFVAI